MIEPVPVNFKTKDGRQITFHKGRGGKRSIEPADLDEVAEKVYSRIQEDRLHEKQLQKRVHKLLAKDDDVPTKAHKTETPTTEEKPMPPTKVPLLRLVER